MKNNIFYKTILAILLYVGLTIIVFFPKIQDFGSSYGMSDIDSDGTLWYQNYLITSYENNTPNEITDTIGYPYGIKVYKNPFENFYQSLQLEILKNFPKEEKPIVLLSNIFQFLTFPLAGLFTFFLILYITKNTYIAIWGGVMFSFSYYQIVHSRALISGIHIELIPLYFLSLLYFLDSKKVYALIGSTFLFSVLFYVQAYYAFFAGFFSLFFFLLYIKQKGIVKLFFVYYILLFSSLILLNLEFIYTNLYMFDAAKLEVSQRTNFNIDSSLIKNYTFFNLPYYNILYPYIIGFGGHTLGFVGVIIFLYGIIKFKAKMIDKRFMFYSVLLFISLIISSNTFHFVNEFYFTYFAMFRSVAFMIHFSILFLTILCSYILLKFTKKRYFNICMISLIFITLIFNLSKDPTASEKTYIKPIKEIYLPLKDMNDIKEIAVYPQHMNYGDFGYPLNYQEVGQMFHGKKITTGADPGNKNAIKWQSEIKDINEESIEKLKNHGVDGIIIHNKLLEDSTIIHNELIASDLLEFRGRYTSQNNKNNTHSIIYKANDISIYFIKNSRENKLLNLAIGKIDNFQKLNANELTFDIEKVDNNAIRYTYPYSQYFSLYCINKGTYQKISKNIGKDYYNKWELNNEVCEKSNGKYNMKIIFELGKKNLLLNHISLIIAIIMICTLLLTYFKHYKLGNKQ